MKKKILVSLSLLFCLVGCKKYDSIIEISYDELQTKIDNNESFIYYIGHDKCSYCASLEKTLVRLPNTTFYYVNYFDLTDSQINKEIEKINQVIPHNYFNDQGYFLHNSALYTPSIYKYIDGELIVGYVGNQSKSEVEEIKNFNLINLNFAENLDRFSNYDKKSKVLFYNDSSSQGRDEFKTTNKEYVDNNLKGYYLKYSSIKESQKESIVQFYNEQYSTDINPFDSLTAFWLEY